MAVSRPRVLQGILDLFDRANYLEIGVSVGETFHAITTHRKVAVDPNFLFDVEEAKRANPQAAYHPVTSDEYFGSVIAPEDRFDVIYLDGLHTSEQTLRDLLNSILYLSPDGVIVIDDVIPDSYAASLPDHRKSVIVRQATSVRNKSWMGDIYRLVFFIETFMQAFTYAVIEDNHGQIVLWRERRPTVANRTIEAVGRLEYGSLFIERSALRLAPYAAILDQIRSRRAAIS